ncbi:hypothetical protein PR048_025928 [Dryococelus australis]|uniref:Uncharacterized protein n=1 Tax=Dryococelus australis TaxID=614101 RepID=A0ABQ9GJY3_9NEOP|nr:hypothetical protein PR048_025928 [Dryococelus australis]
MGGDRCAVLIEEKLSKATPKRATKGPSNNNTTTGCVAEVDDFSARTRRAQLFFFSSPSGRRSCKFKHGASLRIETPRSWRTLSFVRLSTKVDFESAHFIVDRLRTRCADTSASQFTRKEDTQWRHLTADRTRHKYRSRATYRSGSRGVSGLDFTVLYVKETGSFLHWLLHRCEVTPFSTELHVVGARFCEVFIYWRRITQSVSHEANRVRLAVVPLPDFQIWIHNGRCYWSAGFLGALPSPLLPDHSGAAPFSPLFTLVSFRDRDVKNRHFTHSRDPGRQKEKAAQCKKLKLTIATDLRNSRLLFGGTGSSRSKRQQGRSTRKHDTSHDDTRKQELSKHATSHVAPSRGVKGGSPQSTTRRRLHPREGLAGQKRRGAAFSELPGRCRCVSVRGGSAWLISSVTGLGSSDDIRRSFLVNRDTGISRKTFKTIDWSIISSATPVTEDQPMMNVVEHSKHAQWDVDQ